MRRIERVANLVRVSEERVITVEWSERNAGGSFDGDVKRWLEERERRERKGRKRKGERVEREREDAM